MSVKKSDSINPFLRRLRANSLFSREFVYVNSSKSKSPMYDLEKSKTDKEAHRVTLASMRSSVLRSKGSSSVGQYGFEAGTSLEMIRKYDDSYFRRPDLTLADIDNAIRELKEFNESNDKDIINEINNRIEVAEKAAAEKAAADKVSNNSSDSSASS